MAGLIILIGICYVGYELIQSAMFKSEIDRMLDENHNTTADIINSKYGKELIKKR